MLKMVEVIGVSNAGYSEAVAAAVNELIAQGHKPHFFEIVEQRGSVREGKIKEYQVKVKVAVE
jgi:dodecin